VVSDKSESYYRAGIMHHYTEYKTTVRYNGKTYICDDSWLYEEYNKGDKIIVTEIFYPRHKINFEHKWKKKIENY
jgi:DNA gyrase/topoisomerase IV subunit A